MSRVTKFRMQASLREVRGSGDDLVFVIGGHRTKKNRDYEHYEIELRCCRWPVKRLMAEIREMHQRDRARLADEHARIVNEIAELTKVC